MNINEIAKLAGVSPAAVSRYFNGGSISNEKKKKIRRVVEQTGYTPNPAARSLRQRRSDNIGIIVPEINFESVNGLFEGASTVLSKVGFLAVFGNTEIDGSRELEYLRTMKESQLAGIILMGTTITQKHIKIFRDTKVPIVVCGLKHDSVSCIYHDNRGAGHEIARHIIEKGRRRLAFIGSLESDTGIGIDRRNGAIDAMIEAGLDPAELRTVQVRFTIEEGYNGMNEILDSGYVPDGVICATDTLAVGAMQALREHGLSIPGDVSIGGIGGGKLATIVTPQLTTVRIAHRESGERSAKLLLSLINYNREHPDDRLPVTHSLLKYQLIERGSV